jgi:dihydroorotate dehydrogenase
MYTQVIRPLLFRLPPETAHQLTLKLISASGRISPITSLLQRHFRVEPDPIHLFGLTFRNRVGLAAGYDKDAEAVPGLSALGFGHIEVGTITPKPQSGNPKPRVFRLVEDLAVINRMGFPGKGAQYCFQQLINIKARATILGVNIGKNKDTPFEDSAKDYTDLIHLFAPQADYFTINISSPNTVGLRDLQHKEHLETLLSEIISARHELFLNKRRTLPILVKLAPDLTTQQLDEALDVILSKGIDGVIATNTTLSRTDLRSEHSCESGGLSGAPLKEISTRMIAHINQQTNGRLPIIGVGGISSPEDAREKLDAGASLVQVYTGLIYEGPKLVQTIAKNLHF